MAEIRPSSEMKDSGVQWLGNIPLGWKLAVLGKYVTQVKNKNTDLSETNLLSLSYGRIKRKDINTNDGLLPASFDGYNIIDEGDIVLRLTDLQNDHTSLRVGRATERGIITSAYVTIRPEKYISSRYLYYVLHSFDIVKGFYGMGAGIRQGLTYDGVQSLKIPSPDIAEQQAIADFLDDRCSKIDEIIAEATASIEEYKALKQAVIFEAVTKGLDRTVPMKNSGIREIGEIPMTWYVLKLKYVLSISSGDAVRAEELDVDGICPVYGGGEQIGYCNESNCNEENLLIGRVGARCGCVTRLYRPSWATDNALIVTTVVNRDYLYYILDAARLNDLNTSNAQPLITGTKIKNKVVAFTYNLEEQSRIVSFLNKKCADMDALLNEKQALVEDLQAYKKSLIYEVVTGKRRVIS